MIELKEELASLKEELHVVKKIVDVLIGRVDLNQVVGLGLGQ